MWTNFKNKYRDSFFFYGIDNSVLQTQPRRTLTYTVSLQFFIVKSRKFAQLVRTVSEYEAFPEFVFLNYG